MDLSAHGYWGLIAITLLRLCFDRLGNYSVPVRGIGCGAAPDSAGGYRSRTSGLPSIRPAG